MKKNILILSLFVAFQVFSQDLTTGTISLYDPFNVTVKFDMDTSLNSVTMTLVGPSNRYLAVAPGVSGGNGMGSSGDDVIVYNSNGLQDRNMTGLTNTPTLDATNNWTVTSNTVSNSVRTVIATRAINSPDSKDFDFPTSTGSFPLLYAIGHDLTFNQHYARGPRMATVSTLGISQKMLSSFTITPNPAERFVSINLPSSVENARLEIYNILGKKIVDKDISNLNKVMDVISWDSGFYLLKLTADGKSATKQLIKN